MARRRRSRRPQIRKKRAVTRRSQREITKFSKYSDLLRPKRIIKPSYEADPLQDNRFWKPHGRYADVYTTKGKPATYKLRHPRRITPGYDPTRARIGFAHPRTIKECLKRTTRRQVLFALRKTGKGSGGGSRRLTPLSKIRC